jgi:hypothetical protein
VRWARTLLTEHGLQLFSDSSAGPRCSVGYATRHGELIALAHLVAKQDTETGRHPVILAVRWIAAGYTA